MKTKKSSAYLDLQPSTVRKLFYTALCLLWGWFLLKLFISPERPGLPLVVSLMAFAGVIVAIVVFLSDTSYLAHAPEEQIDEYQLAIRNRAYLSTLRYGTAVLIVAWLLSEFLAWGQTMITVPVLKNFLLTLFLTLMIAPAGFVARQSEDLPKE